MKKIFTCVLLFSILSGYAIAPCTNCQGLVFKENKNQWDKQALFETEMHSGTIFFCNNNFTYVLADTTDMNRLRHDLHRVAAYKQDVNSTIHMQAFRATFVNANPQANITGVNQLTEYFNYYLGKDPAHWASHVNGYNTINYQNIYDKIDLNVSSIGDNLKYEFHVQAGGKVNTIHINYEGIDGISLQNEQVVMKTSIGDVTDSKPYAYQIINGQEREVKCVYLLRGNDISFAFPDGYDKKAPLVIDPVLIFSTYSGSTADNFGYSATYDSHGDAYVAGTVFHYGHFPTTLGAFQTSWAGGYGYNEPDNVSGTGTDIGITKYDPVGSTRIYSTYLGGNGDELPHSLVVDSKDELFVFGTTASSNFPVTNGAYGTKFKGGPDPGLFDGIAVHYLTGSDLFVTRFNAAGTGLVASTYIGGTGNDGLTYPEYQGLHYNYADEVRGEIDIDKNDNIYIATCTRSKDFPVTNGAYRTTNAGGTDGVVVKLNNSLSTIIWSTYIGGSDDDAIYSVAFDNNGDLYVAGGTRSTDFPVTNNALQKTFNGGRADGFVAHLSQNGNTLLHSTYYGAPGYDQIYFVETSKTGGVYVLGQAEESGTLFIKNAIYNKPNGGQFISKFTPALDTVILSTSFGSGSGKPDISPTAFLVDVCNKVYVSGWGSNFSSFEFGSPPLSTSGLDITTDAYKKTTDGQDFYVMVLADDASALSYATYFGSNNNEEHVDGGTSRFDRKGVVYQAVCAGCGGLSSFPTTSNVVSKTNNSPNCNNAVFKLDLQLPLVVADFITPITGCEPYRAAFTNTSKTVASPQYYWSFGDGDTSTTIDPAHTYLAAGTYKIQLIVVDPAGCNLTDTVYKQVTVLAPKSLDTLATLTTCPGKSIQIGLPSLGDSISYIWTPANTLSDDNIANPYASPAEMTTYELLASNGVCTDTFIQTVNIAHDTLMVNAHDVQCAGDTVQLSATHTNTKEQLSYSWQPVNQIQTGAGTANPIADPSQSTTYVFTATSQYQCVYTDSVIVNVINPPINLSLKAYPDTLFFGDTTQLTLTASQSVTSFRWEADSTLSATNIVDPLAYPTATHVYYADVEDANGCHKRDSVIVYLQYTPCSPSSVFVPNAFTPNDDGHNDVLYVRGHYITNFHFMVYDRWGQKMFDTRDISKGWDGTFKGKKLTPAVFGYYIEGLCDSGEKFVKKGNVTLLK